MFSNQPIGINEKTIGFTTFCLGIPKKVLYWFRIQPIGINFKNNGLCCFGINRKQWLYNRFRTQPIGINEKALVLIRSACALTKKTLVSMRFAFRH